MKQITAIFFLLIFWSCGDSGNSNNSSEFECSMGQPQAIFQEANPQILNQTFSLNGNSSIENVEFSNGVKLELSQSGCENVQQQFQFSFNQNTQDAPMEFWIAEAIKQMGFLGNLSEKYQPFLIWASFINGKREEFSLNVPLELEPGHFATINKVASKTESHLIIVLESKQ